MNWYPVISGVLSGIIAVATFQILPQKLNIWLRGLISIAVVAIVALAVRLTLY